MFAALPNFSVVNVLSHEIHFVYNQLIGDGLYLALGPEDLKQNTSTQKKKKKKKEEKKSKERKRFTLFKKILLGASVRPGTKSDIFAPRAKQRAEESPEV